MDRYSIGDVVKVNIVGNEGNDDSDNYVIGTPVYSDGSVVVVAAKKGQGMPVNTKWLRQIDADYDTAMQFRNAFKAKFPDFMKEV